MKLKKTTFDQVKPFHECIFRNEYGEVIHAVKISREIIHNRITGEKSYTGQFHEVYLIEDVIFKPRKEIKITFKNKLFYAFKQSMFNMLGMVILISLLVILGLIGKPNYTGWTTAVMYAISFVLGLLQADILKASGKNIKDM